MSTHAEWTDVQNLTVAVLPEHEVPDAWHNGDAPSTCILQQVSECKVCHERIASTDGLHWFHIHSMNEYCGTGDGATAFPIEEVTGMEGENADDCTTHAHEEKAPVLALEDAGNCLAFLIRGDRRQLTALADQITSAVKAFWDPQ